MMLGWNLHALYHYGRAWYEQPTDCYKLGDYVQMMEMYGFPEMALLTIFLYRTLTNTSSSDDNKNDDANIQQQLLIPPPFNDVNPPRVSSPVMGDHSKNPYDLSANEMMGKHCGCHDPWCGQSSNNNNNNNNNNKGWNNFPCWVPMSQMALNEIVVQLQNYCQQSVLLQYHCQQRKCSSNKYAGTVYTSSSTSSIFTTPVPPTAHELLGEWTDSLRSQMNNFIVTSQHRIPELFQFWCHQEESDYRPLVPVVQLLCVKLLYLVIPSLAIEAMIHIRYHQQQRPQQQRGVIQDQQDERVTTHHDWDNLPIQYKSHWAYYIFIESLVLGERIKPSRRRRMIYQHIALWDQLWGMTDIANGTTKFDPVKEGNSALQCNSTHQVCWINHFIDKLQHLLDEWYATDHRNHNANKETPQNWLPTMVHLPPILVDYPWSSAISPYRPIFLMGDSHVLSLAWQVIKVTQLRSGNHLTDMEPRLIVPIVITGLKAWHLRSETRFFTNTCLLTMLRRIPSDIQTIIVSAGEIDCREGMGGPLLQGYTQECYEHVKATVAAYVSSLAKIIQLPSNSLSQILVTPVAPHIEQNKGRVVGHVSRRETIRVWNDELHRQLVPHHGTIFLLDYIDQVTVPVKKSSDTGGINNANNVFALNPVFNADSTHMNGAFAPLVQEAIIRCQCDLSKL
jgi:hypothetical protein